MTQPRSFRHFHTPIGRCVQAETADNGASTQRSCRIPLAQKATTNWDEQYCSTAPVLPCNRLLMRVVTVCLGIFVCTGLAISAGQYGILEADRYIKLGTRLPELPPGEGGELRVVADCLPGRPIAHGFSRTCASDDTKRSSGIKGSK